MSSEIIGKKYYAIKFQVLPQHQKTFPLPKSISKYCATTPGISRNKWQTIGSCLKTGQHSIFFNYKENKMKYFIYYIPKLN